MKKILICLSLVTVICSAFYTGKLSSSNKIIRQQKLFEPSDVCFNYSEMKPNSMNKSFVLEIIRNYYNQQYRSINKPGGVIFPQGSNGIQKDSRAIFFNLDSLKRLIYYIEKSSKGFSPKEKANLGVNIYFASYPSSPNTIINGSKYNNRHTLVFMPSIFETNTTNPSLSKAKDYNMLDNLTIAGNGKPPAYINSAILSNPNFTLIGGIIPLNSTQNTSNMSAQNHGTATPPPFSITGTGNEILDITDPN